MKTYLTLCLLIFTTASYAALDCSRTVRAVVTDQKGMTFDVASKYLSIDIRNDLISLGISEYVSWKKNQRYCLADVYHYGVVSVLTKGDPGMRCLTTVELHTKDNFVTIPTFTREYKAQNLKTECFAENEQEREQTLACEQTPACPRVFNGPLMIKDFNDNCQCKALYSLIGFDDVVSDYEDFYNPNISFDQPDWIQSPF